MLHSKPILLHVHLPPSPLIGYTLGYCRAPLPQFPCVGIESKQQTLRQGHNLNSFRWDGFVPPQQLTGATSFVQSHICWVTAARQTGGPLMLFVPTVPLKPYFTLIDWAVRAQFNRCWNTCSVKIASSETEEAESIEAQWFRLRMWKYLLYVCVCVCIYVCISVYVLVRAIYIKYMCIIMLFFFLKNKRVNLTAVNMLSSSLSLNTGVRKWTVLVGIGSLSVLS